VRVFDWQQANKDFFSTITVERNVMFIILTLIIIVASFNVIPRLSCKDRAGILPFFAPWGQPKA
jgi:ABC-type lipoprotein release transport system permease subunit